MYKEIPYYGKKSIKKIKKTGNSKYEIEVYEDDKNTITNIVYATDSGIKKQYFDTINDYLETKKEAYKLSKDIVDNNTVVKRCKNIAIVSGVSIVALPILGFATSSLALFGAGCVAIVLSAPTLLYTLRELKYNVDTNNIKRSILEYEELLKEVEDNNKKIEPTKFSSVKPLNKENTEVNVKKKMYTKE